MTLPTDPFCPHCEQVVPVVKGCQRPCTAEERFTCPFWLMWAEPLDENIDEECQWTPAARSSWRLQ